MPVVEPRYALNQKRKGKRRKKKSTAAVLKVVNACMLNHYIVSYSFFEEVKRKLGAVCERWCVFGSI